VPSSGPKRRSRSMRDPAIVLLALVAVAGCQQPGLPHPGTVGSGTPEHREAVRSIGDRQAYDVNPGASASALLDQGAQVTIQPFDDAWRVDEKTLAAGVVVAKLLNASDLPVPRYGLPPNGSAYWVVYRDGDAWKSSFIADDPSRKYDRYGVPTLKHRPSRPWRQSIAQWQLPGILGQADQKKGLGALGVALGEQPWITCTPLGCCKPLQ
jgi:hypothetical protein